MLAVARRFQGEGIDVRGATKLDRNMGWGGCDEGTQVKEESSQPQRVGKARQVENGARADLMPHCCANISNRRPPVEDNQIGALDEIPFSNLALELLMMSMPSAKQCQTMSLHVLSQNQCIEASCLRLAPRPGFAKVRQSIVGERDTEWRGYACLQSRGVHAIASVAWTTERCMTFMR